jgi:hypothetical protein
MIREMGPRSVRRMNPVLSGGTFGTAVFFGAHEVAALKLSSSPKDEPLADHVSHLISHMIYGIATVFTYELIRKSG